MSLYVNIEKTLGTFHLSTKFETENEVMGILGASGCGKSLTLRCIAGIVKPDRGKIVLDGHTLFDSEKKINLPPQKRHVGLLFQNYALFPNMTVEKNLLTGLKAGGMDRKQAKEVVARMMERFYLTGLEKHRPSQLSGGQQQRTALARILLTKPRLLMLDEPFSALDGYLRWKVEMELMDILREFDVTTLFVSHSRDEIYRMCQKACVMDHGQSTPVVPVKTMFDEPRTLAACMLSGCKNYSAVMVNPDAVSSFAVKGGAEDSSAKGVSAADSGEGGEKQEGTTWIHAADWGVTLDCGRIVPEDVTNIGVRSHYIHILPFYEDHTAAVPSKTGSEGYTDKDTPPNVIECTILRIVEDVFNMVVMVRPVKAPGDSDNASLRLEMTKAQWFAYADHGHGKVGDRIQIWIEPHDLLLLR